MLTLLVNNAENAERDPRLNIVLFNKGSEDYD